jgi:hypothetical protein
MGHAPMDTAMIYVRLVEEYSVEKKAEFCAEQSVFT